PLARLPPFHTIDRTLALLYDGHICPYESAVKLCDKERGLIWKFVSHPSDGAEICEGVKKYE
ncbi:hypothetical protein L9F63_002774, partial [Diploptera punctata]